MDGVRKQRKGKKTGKKTKEKRIEPAEKEQIAFIISSNAEGLQDHLYMLSSTCK